MRQTLLLALSLTTGCSVWNAPDRGRLDGGPVLRDGGMDAGLDASASPDADAGQDPDAPDGGPPRFERRCNDMMDDDGDGFIDCADLDCAADIVNCCAMGAVPLFTETWGVPGLTGWSRLPAVMGDGPNVTAGGYLSQFASGRGPSARAIIYDPPGSATGCVPIDPGVVITASLRLMPNSTASCDPAVCSERAGILLTAVQPTTAVASYTNGDVLPDELGVRMRRNDTTGTPTVEVTVAGSVVYTMAGLADSEIVTVRIELVPGLAEDGTPVSSTTVTLSPVVGSVETALDRAPAITRSTLLGPASGCSGGRGLYLAVEGVGNRVGVGPLEVVPQVCPNPNHFRAVGDPLDRDSLGAAAWSIGGAGAPSLFYHDEDPSPAGVDTRWDVLFDASDRNRANETFATVRFALGGTIFGEDWTVPTARVLGAPLVDATFPTCGGVCTESNRDPDFWVATDADREIAVGTTALVVWSRRLATGVSQILVDSLEFPSNSPLSSPAVVLTSDPAAGEGAVPTCTGLRSPSLARRPDGGLWLFFVCEHGGMPGDVRVATLSGVAALQSIEPEPVLTRAMAPYASLGIQDVDAEVWSRGSGTTTETMVRLWFVARSGGLPVVALAQGVGIGLDTTVPPLAMFAGNPVLLSNDERLPACAGLCRITSVSAARMANESNVRFLIALTDEATAATRHRLVPLEQTLPLR